MQNLKIKKHDKNNVILRFSNFFNSIALKINFKELDNIRDENILGILSDEIKDLCHYNVNDAILKS